MDIELYYREAGSGEPLIMLHGNGESGEYFINQIEHFQSRYRVIAPDTRGHSRSPRGEAPFTIAQFANDLYDFMQGLGIARAAILGFSDGGNLAIKFALQWPDMVEKLVLNGANVEMFFGVKPHDGMGCGGGAGEEVENDVVVACVYLHQKFDKRSWLRERKHLA